MINKILLILLSWSLINAEPKKTLFDYRHNIFSQSGEDGMISKIFEIIGTTSKISVEFGAWDGIYLSNTANLWTSDSSWQGVLIEGDQDKFKQLLSTVSFFPNCKAINAWVGKDTDDCLEMLLHKNGIIQDIDLLSIDIDGNDYYMIESLDDIRPRVIVVEYNPTIPSHYDIYAPYSKDNQIGASVGALMRIAEGKGYKLVGLSTLNAFFVRAEEFDKFNHLETQLPMINIHNYVVCITTYDGKFAFISNKKAGFYHGLNQQYRGKLCGEYQRIDNEDISFPFDYRPVYNLKS